jgi:RimJ/RimL family protein N-acetyltransferase
VEFMQRMVAVRAALAYGRKCPFGPGTWDQPCPAKRALVAVVRPENEASKRVLTKAGLHPDGGGRRYGANVEGWAVSSDGVA